MRQGFANWIRAQHPLDAKAKDLANQEENWEVGQPRLADQEKALSEREHMLTHRNAESTNTLRQFRRKKHGASQKLPVFKSFAVALTMEDINSRKRKGSCGWTKTASRKNRSH